MVSQHPACVYVRRNQSCLRHRSIPWVRIHVCFPWVPVASGDLPFKWVDGATIETVMSRCGRIATTPCVGGAFAVAVHARCGYVPGCVHGLRYMRRLRTLRSLSRNSTGAYGHQC